MKALVGVIMGSSSDWKRMQAAANVPPLGVAHEVCVISAHRTPDRSFDYAAGARTRGLKVIIAGAGGAAHLPGSRVAKTSLPVLGVPIQSEVLNGIDSLCSLLRRCRAASRSPPSPWRSQECGAVCRVDSRQRTPRDSRRLDAFRAAQTAAVLAKPDPRAS